MIREALEYLLNLRKTQIHEVDGRNYQDRELHPIKTPVIDVLEVNTLNGFMDLLRHELNDFDPQNVLIHIESEGMVALISRRSGVWGERVRHCFAQPLKTVGTFPFNHFMDQESFVIGLQSKFEQTPICTDLQRKASSITAEAVRVSEDDGISQKVVARSGVALKQETILPGRITLQPFRTFIEIAQPGSDFVLRARQSGDRPPELALFEADGAAWKLEAIAGIQSWFMRELSAAGLNIPVVS